MIIGDRVDKTQDNAHEVGVFTTVKSGTSIMFLLTYSKLF